MSVVRSHFKPEFLNRLDDVVVFHALSVIQIPSWAVSTMRRCLASLSARACLARLASVMS